MIAPWADDSFWDVSAPVIRRDIFDKDFGSITKEGFEALGCLIVQTLIFGHLVETSIVCTGC